MLRQPLRLLLSLLLLLAYCSFAYGQDFVEPPIEPAHAEPKTLEIKNLRFVAFQVVDKKKKLVEVHDFLETKPGHLTPSNKFAVECEILGGEDVLAGDYFVWTTVDFLVAPVTRAYERMENNKLSSSVGWGQVTEMRDLRATPIYFLRPGESRQVAVRDLDLEPVLAAFAVGDAGELWPWLLRVTVHVQDRSGKQLASAERTVRLIPNSSRKVTHYNDALPGR